jgi:hypothetical protein
MMSTLTAPTSACASRGSGPNVAHAANVIAATTMTVGTNHAATRSARFWIGARLRCASATMAMMRASSVSAPTLTASTRSAPVPLIVPPTTRSPDCFSTGIGSPLTIDSSTALLPSRTMPSTGIFSPGRTRTRSRTRISSSATELVLPSGSTRIAVFGARSSSARIESPLLRRARSSSTWPTRTSVTMTAAGSK